MIGLLIRIFPQLDFPRRQNLINEMQEKQFNNSNSEIASVVLNLNINSKRFRTHAAYVIS